MNPAHRLPEQRMHRVVVQVLGGFLGFVPVPLGLPRVQRKLQQSRRPAVGRAHPTRSDSRGNAVRRRNSSTCGCRRRCAAESPATTTSVCGCRQFRNRCREHRMRTQFDEVGISVIEHPADRGFEKHCGAGVLPPVGGAVGISVQLFAGDRRIQRDRCRFGRQPANALKRSSFIASM